MMLLFRMLLVLLLAFSSEACEPVTKWSFIGDEFNLRHSSCQEIPADGALKIAVPAGFDLSNSDIIQKKPERWTLTKNGTKLIKFTSTDKIDANQVVEITLSNANAPAHYTVPFHKKFTKFSGVVTKQGVDCAKCTAAAAATATTTTPAAAPVNCTVSDWSELSECSVSCGDGIKTKNRAATTEPENGGAACPALEESEACNNGDCPPPDPFASTTRTCSESEFCYIKDDEHCDAAWDAASSAANAQGEDYDYDDYKDKDEAHDKCCKDRQERLGPGLMGWKHSPTVDRQWDGCEMQCVDGCWKRSHPGEKQVSMSGNCLWSFPNGPCGSNSHM